MDMVTSALHAAEAILDPHNATRRIVTTAEIVTTTKGWWRNAACWLVGFGTSLVATEVFYVALTWGAIKVTSAAGVGLVLLANALPQALLLLVGGVLVDRLGPKRLVIATDSARAAIMVLTAILVTHGPLSLEALVALAVLFGIADGFFLPAVGAMPAFVAPRSALTQLQAFRTITMRAAVFIGAPLASWLIAIGTLSAAFWANAVLFIIAVLALTATRLQRSHEAPPSTDTESTDTESIGTRKTRGRSGIASWWQELTAGLRMIARHQTLRGLVLVVALTELGFVGPFTAGIPLLSVSQGWGVQGIGWMMGAFGVGAAATAGLLALRKSMPRTGVVLGAGLTAMGLSLAAMGLTSHLPLGRSASLAFAVGAALALGLGTGLFGTLANSAFVSLAPSNQIGLVMSVVWLASFTSTPISLAATGSIVQFSNAALPFILGGVLITVAGIFALSQQRIRQVQL
jgi:MFS family permease